MVNHVMWSSEASYKPGHVSKPLSVSSLESVTTAHSSSFHAMVVFVVQSSVVVVVVAATAAVATASSSIAHTGSSLICLASLFCLGLLLTMQY